MAVPSTAPAPAVDHPPAVSAPSDLPAETPHEPEAGAGLEPSDGAIYWRMRYGRRR
jgi:hypothetical protein